MGGADAAGREGSRAPDELSREGGAEEANGSRSGSRSRGEVERAHPGRSRSRDGRGRGETVCECRGLLLQMHLGRGVVLASSGQTGGDPGGGGTHPGVCVNLGARLGLNRRLGTRSRGHSAMPVERPQMREMGQMLDPTLICSPQRSVLVCLRLPDRQFSLVTGRKALADWLQGVFLQAPRARPRAPRVWEALGGAPRVSRWPKGVERKA